jgi:glyoxylase-like metal-dependent hydrolase (beta-lactamase superfamily II)/rhodanese-related sulfurtransferase
MLIRQLFDQTSSTYTYLLADPQTHEAVIIDCVFDQHARDAALIRELDLTLLYALDTHCHADHITGAWRMRETFGCKIGLSSAYGATNVDLPIMDGTMIRFGAQTLQARSTPGHTAGCVSLLSADQSTVFTGDALLVRGAGRTDFQEGSAHRLFQSIREQLFTLPEHCIVYPGHDYQGRTSSTIGEEKRFNPRIGGEAREEDFVGYMTNLGLPHPKLMASAVPANLRSGEPEGGVLNEAPSWGPVTVTYAGLPEIAPEWVAHHRAEVHVLDVRNAPELEGELGHIAHVQLIPLDSLRERIAEVPTDKPVVVVCQSGRRSGLATQLLASAGVPRVANLAGGMLAWRSLGLPSGGDT